LLKTDRATPSSPTSSGPFLRHKFTKQAPLNLYII
jgi:hypothetical protein